MSASSENQSRWTVDEVLNKVRLKELAVALERELSDVSTKSTDMQNFAKYEPLRSAICRAKRMEINVAEVIPGMRFWRFETDMQSFLSFMPSLSKFEFALECWRPLE